MKTGLGLSLAFIVFAAVGSIVIVCYAVVGVFFALLWNWLMPSLWAAAPHFTWKMGIAAAWIIGILQGIFGGGRYFHKKDD